jgi:PAS domain S-box-containing protein
MRTKDGAWKWINTRGKVVGRDAYGRASRFIGTNTDITERRKMEDDLQKSEQKYRLLIDNAGDAIIITDQENRILDANKKTVERLGYAKEELMSMDILKIDPSVEGPITEERIEKIQANGSISFRTNQRRKNGSIIPVEINSLRIEWKGKPAVMSISRDITEELNATESLLQLAKHQETLMKELEHRVKNSLSIVSSLLAIATQAISDKKAKDVLADTQSRIRSMSAIYERLYLSESVDSIDFGTYVDGLANSLFATYCLDTTRIRVEVQTRHIMIDTKRAIPLGLIITELLINAIKYAFPDYRSGTIKVILDSDGDTLWLTISDDGIGIEPKIPETSQTMGMTLIRILTDQIDGSMKLDTSAGTSISISLRI